LDLKEVDLLGDGIERHWYYQSKRRALLRLIQGTSANRVLDVGAGSGYFSKALLSAGLAEEACCVDTSYSSDSQTTHAGKPLKFCRSVDASNANLVMLMDVLEHVDDDVGLLADYVKRVPAGATFVLSVPAFAFMWSGHDVFLEHKRRYTLSQLEAVAKEAGLTVVRGCYFYATVLPLAWLSRLTSSREKPTSQLKRHHPAVNGALASVCALELAWFRGNRLGGLSAFCLATKR
jgi:SAM-dependent methyltransferase